MNLMIWWERCLARSPCGFGRHIGYTRLKELVDFRRRVCRQWSQNLDTCQWDQAEHLQEIVRFVKIDGRAVENATA